MQTDGKHFEHALNIVNYCAETYYQAQDISVW